MSGGSIMWSSMLTRIMSSICMAVTSFPRTRRTVRIATSRHHAADAKVDDRVHVEAQVGEDLVAVLVELRGPSRCRWFLVVLDRCGDEPERQPVGGLAVLDIAV